MKTLADLGVTAADQAQLLRGLHEGKYNLLLGAGASYGCPGGDGIELRDGASLAQEITKAFKLKLNTDEAKKLPLAYEDAHSVDRGGLGRWLRARFVGCNPTWQDKVFRIHWERIWTFNIDDVLPAAFAVNTSQNAHTNITTFDWKGRVTPLVATPNTQQVVYLHGRASDIGTNSDGLIFSTQEYARATREFQQWHAAFQTHYLEDPFIVCGATLAEEVDISEAIRSKNYARAVGFPSFIVSYGLDEGQMERMHRLNLVPIVCPLDEFFSIVLNELNEYRKTADAVVARLRPGTYVRFLAEFRRLDIKDTSGLAIKGTDFYGGDEPTWKDILDDLDAAFQAVEKAASILDRSAQRYAVLIHGDGVSGKSAALLRVARQALRKGFKPFWFRHEEGFDAEVVADYLSNDDKVVLLVDDAANSLEAIGKTLQHCKARGKPARIFLSLRSSRIRGFWIDVADEFRHEFKLGPLRQGDIVNFVKRRRRASRLGKYIGNPDASLIKSLVKECRSELLQCISQIEFSEPLRQRVRGILKPAMGDSARREVVALVACVHRFGFSLPLRVALSSSSLQFGAFKSILDGDLKAEDILVRDSTGIRLRHRILSEYAWLDVFSEDERHLAMSKVVGALAPLVNPAVIRAKGIEHLILREVLDQEQVALSIGVRALQFYEENEPQLGWSSRYWDQRALLELKNEGHFSKAYSYSQKAVSIERHPYAFTSLGTVCMTHATRLIGKNRMEALMYFREGEEALTTAWQLAQASDRAYEHPFVKFFASATHMFRKLDPTDTEFENILQLFRIWLQRASDSPAYATMYGQKRLRETRALEIKISLRIKNNR